MTNSVYDGRRVDVSLQPDAGTAWDGGGIPDHLQAPAGTCQWIHEANLVLTAILIEARAEFNWLNRTLPNREAASRSSSRIYQHAKRLNDLVNSL